MHSPSLANQEDDARATEQERAADENFQNDYAWIVEVLQGTRQRLTREQFHAWICQVLNRGALVSTDQAVDQFREDYGDAWLYRAAARALEVR